jgi:hypothetical protein
MAGIVRGSCAPGGDGYVDDVAVVRAVQMNQGAITPC